MVAIKILLEEHDILSKVEMTKRFISRTVAK